MRDGGVEINEMEQTKNARRASKHGKCTERCWDGVRMASIVQPITPCIYIQYIPEQEEEYRSYLDVDSALCATVFLLEQCSAFCF
jgi:hypothetical protein